MFIYTDIVKQICQRDITGKLKYSAVLHTCINPTSTSSTIKDCPFQCKFIYYRLFYSFYFFSVAYSFTAITIRSNTYFGYHGLFNMYNYNTCMDITSNTDLHKKVFPEELVHNGNYRRYNNHAILILKESCSYR